MFGLTLALGQKDTLFTLNGAAAAAAARRRTLASYQGCGQGRAVEICKQGNSLPAPPKRTLPLQICGRANTTLRAEERCGSRSHLPTYRLSSSQTSRSSLVLIDLNGH